jgi:hypothetical protein
VSIVAQTQYLPQYQNENTFPHHFYLTIMMNLALRRVSGIRSARLLSSSSRYRYATHAQQETNIPLSDDGLEDIVAERVGPRFFACNICVRLTLYVTC